MDEKIGLVLGATGGVGGEVARRLGGRGWTVRTLHRDPSTAGFRDGITWMPGDAMVASDVSRAAEGASLIVHAVNPRRTMVSLETIDAISDQGEARVIYLPSARQNSDPAGAAAQAEVRRLLECAVDQLPDPFRMVFVLRDIEEMSTEETAVHLGLRPETVKTRLHRARRLLRQSLNRTLLSALADAFPCAGARCARITEAVLHRLGFELPPDK